MITAAELKVKIKEMREGFKKIPQEIQEERIHQLACQVIHEAVVDYVGETTSSDKQGLPKYLFNKSVILKDLETQIIMAHSNGANEMAIKALKNMPEKVKENVQKMSYSYDVKKVAIYDKPQFR